MLATARDADFSRPRSASNPASRPPHLESALSGRHASRHAPPL